MGLCAIVFDFDGVLVESVDVKTIAFAELYKPYGVKVVEQVVAFHLANGGMSRYDKFRYYHAYLLHRSLGGDEEEDLSSRFSQLVEDKIVESEWVPGAQEFLVEWYMRLPLYVASGTPQEELRRIIAKRGMTDYFRSIYGSPARKTDILKRILAEGAYRPSDVLMVGDALADFEGASGARTRFIGRVPKGAPNLFNGSVTTIPDLVQLSAFL
jgi:HAD superfamily hydrolase (TIGR01549 family)